MLAFLHCLLGIPAVDRLLLGKTKLYSALDWVESFEKAKVSIVNALNLSEWQAAGRETSFFGTNINSPTVLKGKIICGVDRSAGNDEVTVAIVAGKVLNVYNVSQSNEPPFYRAKIDGPLGIIEINLSGLHLFHVLK